MRTRLHVVLAGMLFWGLAIAARLYHLQVHQHELYRERAARQQQRVVEIEGPRGTIYDRRGRELAVSVAVESAYAVPSRVEDPAATAKALAKVLDLDRREVQKRLETDREFVWLRRKLDRPLAAKVRELELPGVYFLEETKRYYPMRELAAHVLGYVGTDDTGLAGIELQYDEQISGVPVRRTVLRDARRGTALAPELSFADAVPGADLHLTIDASIQHLAERELARTVREHHAKSGSAVFLDPATGEVLALASYPTFDPNHFAQSSRTSWRNLAVADAYEPGSTFKIFTAAAALEHNLVDPQDVFDCEMGGITLASTRISDHKPFGRLTMTEVLAKSSNVGAIKLGLRVGEQRLHAMLRAFGFGQLTGIDLPGENAGILRPLERWRPLSKAYISFGQEVSVTPLQLTVATGAVANGGHLLKPQIVAGLGEGSGELRRRRPAVVGTPISPATVRSLERMLESVTVDGTARRAAFTGYAVAGKTGTAQKVEAGGGYSHNKFVASFVGFAPAREPRLVGLVMIDEPRPPFYHGGDVAAPAFAAIARPALLYLGVRPERAPLVRWPGEPERPDAVPEGIVLASVSLPSPTVVAEPSSEEVAEEGPSVAIGGPEQVPGTFDPTLGGVATLSAGQVAGTSSQVPAEWVAPGISIVPVGRTGGLR